MRGRKREELWEEREAWRAFKKRAGCVDGLRPPGPKKKKNLVVRTNGWPSCTLSWLLLALFFFYLINLGQTEEVTARGNLCADVPTYLTSSKV